MMSVPGDVILDLTRGSTRKKWLNRILFKSTKSDFSYIRDQKRVEPVDE